MSEPRSPKDLQAFMDEIGIVGEILILEVPTPTVEAAALAVGVMPRQIIKSVLFTLPADHVLTISCGDQLVERRAIAELYGVGRKRVRLASPEEVLRLTGYAVGTVPPFGHCEPLRTLIDPHVLEWPEIFAGGGAQNALVRLDPHALLRASAAEIIDLHASAL